MSHDLLVRRRERTHALVEGALLTDIAIVFLLMRAYLPILVARPILLAMAAVPISLLVYRRGVKLTFWACVAAYILFSALVGPLLAIAVMHITIAGILLGIGRRAGLSMGFNLLWTGPIYALLDIVVPTLVSVVIFRYPIHALVESAKNFIRLSLHFCEYVLARVHAPASAVQHVHGWEQPMVAHWQIVWLAATLIFGGYGTLILVLLVVEIVLKNMPEETLVRQGTV